MSAAVSEEISSKIQQLLDASTSSAKVPGGAIFATIDRNGNLLSMNVSGRKACNSTVPMEKDDIFAYYSITKLSTTIACMQLVEKGIVDLDDPSIIERVLPEVATATLIGEGERGNNAITLRMLLTHTAGYGYPFFNERLRDWMAENQHPRHDGTPQSIVQPLVNCPGTRFEYGISIDWAGELVARLTGKTLGEYLRENIFDPLGCEAIDFEVREELKDTMQQRMTGLSLKLPNGKVEFSPKPASIRKAWEGGSTYHLGGGGLMGTAEDFLKISTIMINEGKGANGVQILKPETIESMYEDQLSRLPPYPDGLHPLDVEIPNPLPAVTNSVRLNPGINKGWGISFVITKDELPTGRSPNSIWWAGLANLYWMCDRQKGIANVLFSQFFPFYDQDALQLWYDCEKIVYDSRPPFHRCLEL